MATKKISELEAINAAEDNDVLVIVDTSESTTNKITKGNLLIGAGHTIEMTLNENYQIVLVLKNAAGTALSTQTIDLPNENAITNLTYNNGKLTITKQSGATSEINLTGLIEGLVTESDFNTFKEALQTTLEAINEKDAEQDEAIAENYKVINKLNERLEDQQKVINQLPQVEGQGTSITLENTIEAQFTVFDVEGNSTQDGTPSPDNEVPILSAGDNENLFDISLLPITKNGVTISKDSKGNVVLNGTPTITSGYINFNISATKQFNAGIYTVSFAQKKVGIGSTIIGFGNGQLNLTLDETVNSKTANISNAGNARFDINVRYDVGTLDNFILNPKLEKGNKASGYSPFGMGSISEKIVKKNLFNKTINILDNMTINNNTMKIVADNTCKLSYLPCKPNTTYTISRSSPMSDRFWISTSENIPKIGETLLSLNMVSNSTTTAITMTTPANAHYMIIRCIKNQVDNYIDYVATIQVEYGNQATTYTSYQEQDYSIFVQQPMMDDDHFDRKNNKEVHTWIKYVLDGSDDENWSIRNNKFFIVDNINYSLWGKSISPNGKSNIGVISYSVLDNHTGYGLALAYGLRLNLENIDASNGGTIEQLRAYLAEHPITIYVKLKDSAYEKLPCTPEQIQQLENKPSTYKDFTIIQSQDETPAYLEVSGIRDINTMFDKVTNAIVSLGENV